MGNVNVLKQFASLAITQSTRLRGVISAILMGWLFVCPGCITHAQRVTKLRNSYFQGDLATASLETERLLSDNPRDESLIRLDQSLVALYLGNPDDTESTLRKIRDQFTIGKNPADLFEISSWLLDEQSRSYQPDDYEKLFVLVYLALANLLQNGDDAFAYANQITAFQTDYENQVRKRFQAINSLHQSESSLNSNAKTKTKSDNLNGSKVLSRSALDLRNATFDRVALAPFIAGLLHEQTHRDYDSAERYYQRAASALPSFVAAREGLNRCRHGHHSQKGNGVLYVFAAIGKGPFKVEQAEVPTSQALLIADRLLSSVGDHSLPPTIAPIKTARVVVPENQIERLSIEVNGRLMGKTETAANLGQMAIDQDRIQKDLETARAIVRRVLKKSAIYASKNALNIEKSSWADLLFNSAGILWEAAESADTRCWGILPEKIQVLRIELPVGVHQIRLTPVGVNRPESQESSVEIRDGLNTYLLACFPGEKAAGEVLVSRP